MDVEAFSTPLHIVIPDDRLRRATRIAAGRRGISIRAYVEDLLRRDAEITSALEYADRVGVPALSAPKVGVH